MMNKARFFEFQRQEKGSITGGSRVKGSLLQVNICCRIGIKIGLQVSCPFGELAWMG
ncbi:hypothetical protein COLO4_21473 [Corchorus olitorius]|uniref:Uncharacterized protein n=1 Tax=Corchorus olitorius TaxID=93759 RepID=A0A1R3IT08_9ROSI|nr:hypothetical protein COLO4_21473 [Corchorus olitorius]